jgi:hypothetical protein
MPTLTPTTKAIRTAQASKAISLMATGLSQKDACSTAGITPDQLRHWLGKESTAIQTLRDISIELEKENLVAILTARRNIIARLADVVATTPLPARDLVVIDEHLRRVQEELENKYGTQSSDKDAQEYLDMSGPTLIKHTSIFQANVKLDLPAKEEGEPPLVIEATAQNVEEEEDD